MMALYVLRKYKSESPVYQLFVQMTSRRSRDDMKNDGMTKLFQMFGVYSDGETENCVMS